MSIAIQQLSYLHPDREPLFREIGFSLLSGQKVALIGDNGSGKSTLLQIMGGRLPAASGEVICRSHPYYVPQHFGQYNGLTVAQALQIDGKLEALQAILSGDVSDARFSVLADDWAIEERARTALSAWGLAATPLSRVLSSLSGGEKSRVFLAGITLHAPDVVLLDEPTNHLDPSCRKRVYDWICSTRATVIAVSHDRALLNLLPVVYELDRGRITYYDGNYDAYREQREICDRARLAQLYEKEKSLRLARKTARETAERRQKHDARGEKNNARKGFGRMAMNMFRDQAEKSCSKLADIHAGKLSALGEELSEIRSILPETKAMKVDFHSSVLHMQKILLTADAVNYTYETVALWEKPLSFQVKSGERIRITGRNGSGKTSLLKLMTGVLQPTEGTVVAADFRSVYLDQEYSLIRPGVSVYDQVRLYNGILSDAEIKTILNRFLFPFGSWEKDCAKLSGGERMKLALCCLMVSIHAPDLFVLDEPTNNLDIRSADILTETIRAYRGTVCVVSHDDFFIREIGIDRTIAL